jgi:hypothetical protein
LVLLTILSLAFLYSVVRDLHQRYLIRCWIKAFTDANKAVQFLQEFPGVRLELGQLDAPMLPT